MFRKDDTGKPRMDLLIPEFLLDMGTVLGHGAEKYGDNNWQECNDPQRYYAAALRHLLRWGAGESLDLETGISHLIHAAVNLMFLDRFGWWGWEANPAPPPEVAEEMDKYYHEECDKCHEFRRLESNQTTCKGCKDE